MRSVLQCVLVPDNQTSAEAFSRAIPVLRLPRYTSEWLGFPLPVSAATVCEFLLLSSIGCGHGLSGYTL
jgi:hypothetical protein